MKNTADIVDAPIHDEKTDYHYMEGSYFPPQFKIVGVAFIIAGCSLCLQMNFIGLLPLILGMTTVLARRVLTVSFTLSRYRRTFTIFNYPIGQWKTLPEFESISVFSAKKSQEMAAGSQSMTALFSEIEVNLVYNKNKRLTVYETKDFNKALEVARILADKFKIQIYDATQREGKWL